MRAFYLLLAFVAITSCNAEGVKYSEERDVQSELFFPVNPIIKFAHSNPVFQLKISVEAGRKELNVSEIKAEIISGTEDLEKLELYYTSNEKEYLKDSLMAVMYPGQKQLSIPVSIQLPPGVHYFWMHAILKEDANIEDKIVFRVKSFLADEKEYFPINDDKEQVQYTGIAIRKAWDDSVHTYRIPGMIVTHKGTLIAIYDIRYHHSGDLPANIDVGMNRSTDGGKTWEPMKIIMDMGAPHENNGVGDPAILFDPVSETIWVAALWSKGNNSIRDSRPGLSPDSTGQLVLISSTDDGITWSEPVSITPQVKNPQWHLYFNGPGAGIVMQNGHLVFASQYWDENKIPYAAIIYSEDHGQTWKSGVGAKSNTTEAQIVETRPGTLMLNMRDNRGKYRSVATTTDMGKTWVEHHTSGSVLEDPVCMAGFIKAEVNHGNARKEVLFLSNVNHSYARVNTTIRASLDWGETWPEAYSLLIDERSGFGYSSIARINEDTIGLLYEGIRDLYFVRIPVKDILK